MPNTNKSHPEKWFKQQRQVSAQLTADETLAMAMMLPIQTNNKDVAYAIFCVVRKGDKAITRNIVCHVRENSYCEGHADDMAEYEAVDEEALIEETRNQVIAYALKLMIEDNPKLSLDKEKPVYYMKVPAGQDNTQIVKAMIEETNPEGDIPKQVIIQVLGLARKQEPAMMTKTQNEEVKPKSSLAKAAEELALIEKFGRRKMEKLAKEMKYQGELINNKNKEHASNKNGSN